MESRTNQNQIVITTSDNEKQKLPINLIFTLVVGAITGMVVIFGLFWGAEKLMGL